MLSVPTGRHQRVWNESPTKPHCVKRLMEKIKAVLFCGDEADSAAAVVQPNVCVQVGFASDVTRSIADVVLVGGLDGIPILLDGSKRAFHRIIFNFA